MDDTTASTPIGQPMISSDDRRIRQFEQDRRAFFAWLDEVATQNAYENAGLGEAEVLALIEQARTETATPG